LASKFADENAARGEIVLVINRAANDHTTANVADDATSLAARVAAFEIEGLDARAALKRAARESGLSRSEAYRRLIAERARQQD